MRRAVVCASPSLLRMLAVAAVLVTDACATAQRTASTAAAPPATPSSAPASTAAAASAAGSAGTRAGGAAGAGRGAAAARGFQGDMDSVRARQLYVSNDPKDLPKSNFGAAETAKLKTDSIYAARFNGVLDFRKITYTSTADGATVPAYLFAPLNKRGARGHAAMIWVHGGVHGNWDQSMLPFVREAVGRGYV